MTHTGHPLGGDSSRSELEHRIGLRARALPVGRPPNQTKMGRKWGAGSTYYTFISEMRGMDKGLHDTDIKAEDIPNFPWRGGCVFVLVSFSLVLVCLVVNYHFARYSNNGRGVRILRRGVDEWNLARQNSSGGVLDLSRTDLRGMDLSGGDFHGISFFDNWYGSNLSRVDLEGANLSEANLGHALLVRSDLSGANLFSVVLGYSDMSGATLRQADARYGDFVKSNMRDADLSHCDFSMAEFFEADLTGARLAGVDFTGADLTMATFTDVKEWEAIRSIRCANIYGVQASYRFKQWALSQGAVVFDYGRNREDWLRSRDACASEK